MVITAIAVKKTCWDGANNNVIHLIRKAGWEEGLITFSSLPHSVQRFRFTTKTRCTLKLLKQKVAISHLDNAIWSQGFHMGILLSLEFQALLNFCSDWNGL